MRLVGRIDSGSPGTTCSRLAAPGHPGADDRPRPPLSGTGLPVAFETVFDRDGRIRDSKSWSPRAPTTSITGDSSSGAAVETDETDVAATAAVAEIGTHSNNAGDGGHDPPSRSISPRPNKGTRVPAGIPPHPCRSRPPVRVGRPGITDPGGLDLIGDIHGHADVLDRLPRHWGTGGSTGFTTRPGPRSFSATTSTAGPTSGGPWRRSRPWSSRTTRRHGEPRVQRDRLVHAEAGPAGRPARHRHSSRLIEPTLQAIDHGQDDWLDWVDDFQRLESKRLRAVHACWNEAAARHLQELLDPSDGVLEESPMQATCERGTASCAIEQLLKGEEVPLPDEIMTDPEDPPSHILARWFESPVGRTYRDYAMTTDDRFPTLEIPREAIPADFVPYGTDERPIFVGHYWMRGDVPRRLAPNVACLDWSVARGGPLVAYRFDGEAEIDEGRFVAVP